jgi:hypothetical protein
MGRIADRGLGVRLIGILVQRAWADLNTMQDSSRVGADFSFDPPIKVIAPWIDVFGATSATRS